MMFCYHQIACLIEDIFCILSKIEALFFRRKPFHKKQELYKSGT